MGESGWARVRHHTTQRYHRGHTHTRTHPHTHTHPQANTLSAPRTQFPLGDSYYTTNVKCSFAPTTTCRSQNARTFERVWREFVRACASWAGVCANIRVCGVSGEHEQERMAQSTELERSPSLGSGNNDDKIIDLCPVLFERQIN